ncbi:MAG: hypothetical protein IPH04_19755 [Saprospirales bacterium]|nr:hypothetical protein [Saprospirales bacterium]
MVKPTGIVGLLTPSGISADKSASEFFKRIATEGHLAAFFDFENKKVFFPDVDSRFKFCAYIAGGKDRTFPHSEMAFFLHDVEEIKEEGRIRTREELEKEGCYPVEENRLKRGDEVYVPLYVGRMIHHYDHRSASVEVNEENLHNPALSAKITSGQLQDPSFFPKPQFYVNQDFIKLPAKLHFAMAFRDIARSTDMRTFINTLVPRSASGNKLPLLLPENDDIEAYIGYAPLLTANLSSFVFDYVARQKVQSTAMNWYIVEQLPLIPKGTFQRPTWKGHRGEFIREQVLHLTHTASDMEPFARALGFSGPPFQWDEAERRHRRAKLDALFFFNLYGIDEYDADYILSTFPIVRKQDESDHGRFLTRDLILAYMRALRVGDTEVRVVV